MSQDTQERLLNIDELAEWLNVPKQFLYRMTSEGRIPFVRVGPRFIRFRPSEISAWLEQNRETPLEE